MWTSRFYLLGSVRLYDYIQHKLFNLVHLTVDINFIRPSRILLLKIPFVQYHYLNYGFKIILFDHFLVLIFKRDFISKIILTTSLQNFDICIRFLLYINIYCFFHFPKQKR